MVRELSVTTEISAHFPLSTSSDPSCPGSWTINKKKLETGSSVCALINSDSSTDFPNDPSSCSHWCLSLTLINTRDSIQYTRQRTHSSHHQQCPLLLTSAEGVPSIFLQLPPHFWYLLHEHCQQLIYTVCRENGTAVKVYFRQSNPRAAVRSSGKDLNSKSWYYPQKSEPNTVYTDTVFHPRFQFVTYMIIMFYFSLKTYEI